MLPLQAFTQLADANSLRYALLQDMKKAEDYATAIMEDDISKIVNETPTVYEDEFIERVYEFEDGAVVKYEWQGLGALRTVKGEVFNHKFTLVELPKPNLNNFEKGVIRLINYPQN